MTLVSKSHTAVGVSTSLNVPRAGTTVDFALSGTYAATIQFERALTPDESAWEVVAGPYSIANATQNPTYTTKGPGERLRSRCIAFTSGTAVTTLQDRDAVDRTVKDNLGASVGSVGSYGEVITKAAPYAVGSTKSVTADGNAGRIGNLDTAAGSTVTLPKATGSGAIFPFAITVKATSNSHKIQVVDSVDIIQGIIIGVSDDPATVKGWIAGAADDTITLNRTTTGSVSVGEVVTLVDWQAGIWLVVYSGITQSGTEATPFSSAV